MRKIRSTIRGKVALVAFLGLAAINLVACVERNVATYDRKAIRSPEPQRLNGQKPVDDHAVLFVVDDSTSMGDKQALLAKAVASSQFLIRECDAPDGSVVAPGPGNTCPEGSVGFRFWGLWSRALVTTSSMEAGGSGLCLASSLGAHPLNSTLDGEIASTLRDVGEQGCGFEAPLEAMYRFLVDPEPPESVEVDTAMGRSARLGLDQELLDMRDALVEPFSDVTVVILTDEDDCSIVDSEDGWRLGEADLAPGSSECADDPESACCRPCDAEDSDPFASCAPLAEDPRCEAWLSGESPDSPRNVRCFDQKRRFGKSRIFAVERYVEALSSPTLTRADGTRVENPLFAHGRTLDMVRVLLLTGTPWQFFADPSTSADGNLDLLNASELDEQGVFARLGTVGAPATDPHMVESLDPRPGLPLAGGQWDPISGHEVVWPNQDNLQHSCVFELTEPPNAETGSRHCATQPPTETPICLQPDGTYGEPQRFASASPPPRLLTFAQGLGERALMGSICPKQLESPDLPGYGYADALAQAFSNPAAPSSISCFTPSLPTQDDGTPRCALLEYHEEPDLDCADLGRATPAQKFRDAFDVVDDPTGTICEIPRMPGEPGDPSSDYYRCAHDLHPNVSSQGYCYVDVSLSLGDPELVTPCIQSHKRRFRAIPNRLGHPGTQVQLLCDYAGGE